MGITRVIGLTGGIGTGKSTVAKYLIDKGFTHIDADDISRSLTADGSPMLAILNNVFGPSGEMGVSGQEILNADGSLIRQALADIVFTDETKKDKLNDIMLKEIIAIIDSDVEKARSGEEPLVLIDAPLLFESGLESRCDEVMLVVADMDIRIDRVCKRDNITPKQVRDRINNQLSDDEKIKLADCIIDNSKDLKYLHEQLDTFIKNIQK